MDILQLQEKHIYQHLQPIFHSHGFEKLPDKQQFRKQNSQGFTSVQLSLKGSPEGQLIKLQLGLRKNKIEDLVQQFLAGPETKACDNQTMVASVSRFYPHAEDHHLFTDEKSLRQSCREITSFMKLKGFRFLESTSRLRRIDALLNRQPEAPSPYMHNQIHRCFKGIATASILHRTDFNKLVTIYSDYLNRQCAPREVINNFKKLVNYLRYFSFN